MAGGVWLATWRSSVQRSTDLSVPSPWRSRRHCRVSRRDDLRNSHTRRLLLAEGSLYVLISDGAFLYLGGVAALGRLGLGGAAEIVPVPQLPW